MMLRTAVLLCAPGDGPLVAMIDEEVSVYKEDHTLFRLICNWEIRKVQNAGFRIPEDLQLVLLRTSFGSASFKIAYMGDVCRLKAVECSREGPQNKNWSRK